MADSYIPSEEERDWRALVRHRASLVRMSVDVKNRVQSLLDRYELKHEFSDFFDVKGVMWLQSLKLEPVDKIILKSDITLPKNASAGRKRNSKYNRLLGIEE